MGTEYSSKWSPFLAHGCVSPRWIYHRIRHFEKSTRISNRNTEWSVVVMLVFRDWMKFECLKYGDKIFYENGAWGRSKYEPFSAPNWSGWRRDKALFAKWTNAETGYPFIDAAMTELNKTGYLSLRWRLAVASFLVKDMRIDWRWGAEYFEATLVDYDCAMNFVNWNFVAGVGFDRGAAKKYISQFRYAALNDREGHYVKLWLPQMRAVSKRYIHSPWLMGATKQKINRFHIGTDYCERCVPLRPPPARPTDPKREREKAIRERFQIRHVFQDMLE